MKLYNMIRGFKCLMISSWRNSMPKLSAKKSDKRTVSGKRGKTSGSTRKTGSYSEESNNNSKEIVGLVLLGIGILSFASIIIPSDGALLSTIRYFFRGVGGQLCLLLPLLLCGLGIFILLGGDNAYLNRKIVVCSFIIFLLVETILQSSQLIGNNSWPGFILESYKYSGNSIKGGGAIGSLLAWPLVKALDTWGCNFVSIVGVLIALMVATGISFGPIGNKLSEILDDLRVGFSNRWADFQADREDRAREKMEARQRRLEEETRQAEEEEPAHTDPLAAEPAHSHVISKAAADLPKKNEIPKERPFPEQVSYESPDEKETFHRPADRSYDGVPNMNPAPVFHEETAVSAARLRVVRNGFQENDLYIAADDEFEAPSQEQNPEDRGFTEEEAIRAFEGTSDNKTDGWSDYTPASDLHENRTEGTCSDAHGTEQHEEIPKQANESGDSLTEPEDSLARSQAIPQGSFGTFNIPEEVPKRSSRRRVTPKAEPTPPAAGTVFNVQPEEEKTAEQKPYTVSEIKPMVKTENSGMHPIPEDQFAADDPAPNQEGEEVIAELRERRLDSTPIVMPKKDTHESLQTDEYTYVYPSHDLLDPSKSQFDPEREEHDRATGQRLIETLNDFGVKAKLVNCTHGPAITRYEIQPDKGVKVSRITTLADDIALNLASDGVRIEAPVPGKPVVGIEVPNRRIETVCLRDVLESDAMQKEKSPTAVALGKGISGAAIIADMAKMPHVLIAGATGSGKSVCINTIIQSIIFRAKPTEVRLILIDPKVVELSVYNGIPHLLIPVVTDPKKASAALSWAVVEMEQRYKRFETMGVRDIKGYNAAIGSDEKPMPKIIVIIDELADLMMVAPGEVEDSICRLAQLARAAGIHLVIATQRPSVNVITGVIKANIPSRIAFAVSSQIDSRTILDAGGAEKLLGKGDMLYAPQGVNKPTRVQGCFVTDEEVQRVVNFVKNNHETDYSQDVIEQLDNAAVEENKKSEDESSPTGEFADEMFRKAIELAVDAGQVSISMLQRRLRVGYARAGRLVDEMTEKGITAEAEGPTKPRKVLITREEWNRMQENM